MSRFAEALDRWADVEGLPSAFASARDSVDVLLRDRGLRRIGPDATALALARGAEASARIEAFDGAAGPDVASAALRLNAELLALAPVVGRSPAQALARMHALAGLGASESLGRPRLDDGTGGVAAALQAFGRDLVAADAPGLVVAALAHAELAVSAPFAAANGLVARALERLLLVARGVDPASCLVPEAGHLAMGDEYRAALEGYRAGSRGLGHWLSYAAQATVAGAKASPLADSATA